MSYQSFEFQFPTRIVFGPGEAGRAAVYAAQFQPKKVMILTYADVLLPVVNKLQADLEEAGIAYVLYNRCEANPKAEQIDTAAAFFLENGCDLALGVGGGSVIDSTKATALLAANFTEGGIWPYVSGEAEAKNQPFPIMLVVTIASTGSEGNESFVITDNSNTQKLICNDPRVRPALSVCDPKLALTLPPRQTALGALDVFSHVLEQYLHADPNVDASDEMSFGLLKTVYRWGPIAVKDGGNMDARSNLLWCAILAMSRVLGVGHEENWLSHMLEHAVSAKYNLPHAAGMAAIFPAYLKWMEEKDLSPEKRARLAKLLGGKTAWEGLAAFQKELGLPVSLPEALGCPVSGEVIREMAVNSLPWGAMECAGYGEFTQDDAAAVFAIASSLKAEN